MREPVTKENVFKRPQYRSILNLLIEFQEHKGGLEQRHMRYALIKGHDKENLHKSNKLEMEAFFGERLQYLYDKKLVEACITSRNALNNFLRTLLNLKAINRVKKGKKGKYKISKQYSLIGERIINKQVFDWYKNLTVIDASNNSLPEKHYIYGLSDEMYKSLSKEDKDKIDEYIDNITDNLFEINNIVNKSMGLMLNDIRYKIQNIFKQQFPQNTKLHKFIDEICSNFFILMFMETFEQPLKKEDKKPSGYPFEYEELDRDSSGIARAKAISKFIFELRHNLIYHKDELIEFLEIPIELGDFLYETMRKMSKAFNNIYDLNMISYSYCSKGIYEKTIDNVISRELIE
jgi:hypothetical protein